MEKNNSSGDDLRLCGEHINLKTRSRFGDEIKKIEMTKFRPRSALLAPTKNTPENSRRPFSAGTEPTSPKLHSFLRHTNIRKPDQFSTTHSAYYEESILIPGAIDSLFCENSLYNLNNKKISHTTLNNLQFPIKQNNNSCDNVSDTSSVDTCVSLGTKIKARAKHYNKLSIIEDYCEIEGSHIEVKKLRPHMNWMHTSSYDCLENKDVLNKPEKDISDHSKLLVCIPNIKDENTSSGISSSSEIQNITSIQKHNSSNNGLRSNYLGGSSGLKSKKAPYINWFPVSDKPTVENKKNVSSKKISNNRFDTDCEDLSGRVSFGKSHEQYTLTQETGDLLSNFNTQLSLVEEESSEDSELSLKYLSYKINDDKLQHKSDKEANMVEPKIKKNNKCNSVSNIEDEENTDFDYKLAEKYLSLDNKDIGIECNMDEKIKSLEKKYKNRVEFFENDSIKIYKSESNDVKDSLFCSDYGFQNYDNEVINNSADTKVINMYSINEKYKDNISSVLENERDKESDKLAITNSKTDDSVLFANKKLLHVEGVDQMKTLDDPDNNFQNNYNIIRKMIIDKKSNMSDENEEYPEYLKENCSKSYTSKVIEEYKKEINQINNFHELTVKDLRKRCNDLKSYIDKSPNSEIETYVTSSSDINEDDKILLSNHSKSKSDSDISIFNEIKSSTVNYNSKWKVKMEHIPKIYNEEKETIINNNNNGKRLKSKFKKKYKKSDKTPINKSHLKGTITYQNRIIKSNLEGKKTLENISKNNRGIVKFKAQKIVLSKSSSGFAKTMYGNNDKDIISWMETRKDIPFENDSITSDTFDEVGAKIHSDDKKIDVSGYRENNKWKLNDCQFVHFDDEESKLSSPNQHKSMENREFIKCLSENDANNQEQNSLTIVPKHCNKLNKAYDLDINDAEIINELTLINTKPNLQICSSNIKTSQENITNTRCNLNDENTTTDYKEILNFLEKVEKGTNEHVSTLSHNQPLFALKVEELMELSKAELAHRAIVSAIAAGKATSAAAELREALGNASKTAAAEIKVVKTTAKHQAAMAAAHASQSLSRQQKFIEQLVNEKKALTERIEQLAGAAAGAEARRNRASRTAAERLQLELRNQKQRLTAAHQRDKQAWLKHHTHKIKEMTIKGIENELQEIENKHATQLLKMQQEKEKALADQQDLNIKEMRKLKETMTQQLEDELDKERLTASERLEQKRAEWEMALVKTIEKTNHEAFEAVRQAEETSRNARLQADIWKAEQEKELIKQKETMEKEICGKKATIMEELSILKGNLLKEFENHKDEYNKKQAIILKEKESEVKAYLRRERDREIEKAIDCIEMEAQEGRKEMHDTIRRIKEKCQSDILALEDSEKMANQRYKETREQLLKIQELYAASQIIITQLEGKLKQAEELRNQNEVHNNMLIRAAEMKAQENTDELKTQIQNLQQQHKDEMHQLFARVKVVIARKDEATLLAQKEAASLRERCIKLEAKISV